jgi:hypothetical protein
VMSWYFQQLRAVAQSGAPNAELGVFSAFRQERNTQREWVVEARGARTIG